jgi:HTH-type transcriptional regulator/antitoxin MqsA
MGRQSKTQPCPECGGVMRYEEHDDVLSYKGHTRTIQTLGWWCTKCGEGILTGDALVAHEQAFQAFKAEVDGVLSPGQVAAVREKLGLSQRKASELLGGGPRAFQKYEVGTQAVSTPMSNLLRLLDNDPSRLEEILDERTVPVKAAKSRTTKARKAASGKRMDFKRTSPKAAARKASPRKKRAAS